MASKTTLDSSNCGMKKAARSSVALVALSLPLFLHGFSPPSTPSLSPLSTSWSSSATALSSTDARCTNPEPRTEGEEREAGFWKWRGHDVFAEVVVGSNKIDYRAEDGEKKPAVVLLHGFGASTAYWRETVAALRAEGHDVHALDLLGQGRSSKPFVADEDEEFKSSGDADMISSLVEMGNNSDTKVEYSINLWANLVDDYARHRQLEDVVLMGNSLGSLVCLSAATADFIDSATGSENSVAYLARNDTGERSRVRGLCLFNCGVGMNSRNIVKNADLNPLQRVAFGFLFDVLNALIFNNKYLLRFALNNIITKELLEDALKGLYIASPERVDGELVDSFYYPAKLGGEGAVEAIRQIYTNDAGLTPMELHEKYPEILDAMPIHLVWGQEDVVTPIDGDVGMFYRDRVANNRGGTGMTTIDCIRSGHIPFDDNPAEAHKSMMRWLKSKKLVVNRNG